MEDHPNSISPAERLAVQGALTGAVAGPISYAASRIMVGVAGNAVPGPGRPVDAHPVVNLAPVNPNVLCGSVTLGAILGLSAFVIGGSIKSYLHDRRQFNWSERRIQRTAARGIRQFEGHLAEVSKSSSKV